MERMLTRGGRRDDRLEDKETFERVGQLTNEDSEESGKIVAFAEKTFVQLCQGLSAQTVTDPAERSDLQRALDILRGLVKAYKLEDLPRRLS